MSIGVISIQCGKAMPFREDGTLSAIDKQPVSGPVRVEKLGLAGDEQADLSVHGGPDKAIHHYPHDHYPWWSSQVGNVPILSRPGAFGENISTLGLTETNVCIGDVYRLGTATVQVSQGRQPCWKLDRRFGGAAMNVAMIGSRRCGWYYRVVEEGEVAAGDTMTLVERPYPDWSVARVFGLLISGDHKKDRNGLQALGEVTALAEPWERRRTNLLAM